MITKFKITNLFHTQSKKKKEHILTGGKHSCESVLIQATSSPEDQSIGNTTISDLKKSIHGSVTIFEGTYQGKPIRVRIIGGSVQNQSLE